MLSGNTASGIASKNPKIRISSFLVFAYTHTFSTALQQDPYI
jgi:hypothetical protein